MNNIIRVKKAQFFYQETATFKQYFNNIYGNGYMNLDFKNKLVTGEINNPSGLYPAVFYTTGILSGVITDNLGYYRWTDVNISGLGESGSVYLDYITGYIPATGIIEIDSSYLTKLTNGDLININDVTFNFVTGSPTSLFEFNNIEYFVNVLNSGFQGLYSDIEGEILKNDVGVSGKIEYGSPYNKIYLTSISNSGENGNENRIYRDCEDLNLIKIPNRYFYGGQTLRPLLNEWTGIFSTDFSSLIKENSGFYYQNINNDIVSDTSGIIWENNFSGNYFITTGIKNRNSEIPFSGDLMKFNYNFNKYTGIVTIPSGKSLYNYTTFKFNILKQNPYNISGNIAKYIISGNNFIFSGFIEG